MLYVTMQLEPGLSLDQFHEWYNNEHGPTRLALPQIFINGLRYRATDGKEPKFLAAYDVTSMSHLETPTYTSLREQRSPREAETIGQIDVKRHFFDLVATQQSPLFLPIEQLTDAEATGLVLVAVEVTLKDGAAEAEQEVIKWYEEEHFPMLAKVPGWLRSRVFRTSSLEGSSGPMKLWTLHEYAVSNGLGGPEHKASMATPRRETVFKQYIEAKARRTYELFYVFGAGSRDLESLSRLPASAAFTAPTGKTSTTPGSDAVITSKIAAADGLQIPYRLEGNPAADAPVVAFCNSLLTSLNMWDPLVALLKAARPDLKILRYDTRGRHEVPDPPVPATLEVLAADLASVLKALRIDTLFALIGVSMGGATSLRFALTYGKEFSLGKVIACDFNVASSEANTKAWGERIAVAEDGPDGMSKLSGVTVERWFHPRTMTDDASTVKWMTDMVAGNHVRGFRYSCQALWNYNMREEMKACEVPSLLVVGEGDAKGALVKAMDGFKSNLGKDGAELKLVSGAGHLPMCENPQGFWDAIKDFL
jgi:pimeloyl-ACP methyl ester carboxylesterase